MSQYVALVCKSSRRSEGNLRSNYIKGSSKSKGSGKRLILAGSDL
jgi:hypothetical protein